MPPLTDITFDVDEAGPLGGSPGSANTGTNGTGGNNSKSPRLGANGAPIGSIGGLAVDPVSAGGPGVMSVGQVNLTDWMSNPCDGNPIYGTSPEGVCRAWVGMGPCPLTPQFTYEYVSSTPAACTVNVFTNGVLTGQITPNVHQL